MNNQKYVYFLSAIILFACLNGCSRKPQIKPASTNNICAVFSQQPSWYRAAEKAQQRWGTPIHVQMAIMHQESRFKRKAKAPRKKLLGILPWTRSSSAYGYSQALEGTWKVYKKATKNRRALQSHFPDAIDFIAWYAHQAHIKAGAPMTDARALYLAHHEGTNGYKRGTYRNKDWLKKVADKVARQAKRYQLQLKQCEHKFKRKRFFFFF